MMGYFAELIERRRREPGDDTISHLVAAGVGADGDIAGTLSVLAFTFTMVTGGNDTTTGMLGGSVQLLHQRPDQRRLLIEQPGLIPDAVEELLRLTSPVQGLARTLTRDVELHGKTIPAGRKALLLYGSANRDERQYGPDAGELDVTRRPRNILTFSHGAHHCLGAAAARMQSRVALTELLERCPDFEVDEAGIVWAGGGYVRRPLSVPVRVDGLMAGGTGWAHVARRWPRTAFSTPRASCSRTPTCGSVGMNEIARAAGCSRATLYRYFENREALHTAYVHREAYRLHQQMTDLVGGIADPRERLVAGLTTSMRLVRESPALSSWFTTNDSPIGAEMAEQSEVIQALTSGFLLSLTARRPSRRQRRARWLVRVLTSLLIFPGHDADDERAMLEEFVVPLVCPSRQQI